MFTSQADILPTSEDIKAGIDANLANFRSVRIVWTERIIHTAAWYGYLNIDAEHIRNKLKKARKETKGSFLSEELHTIEYQAKGKKEIVYLCEYLTDGSGFQWRFPAGTTHEGFDQTDWIFSSEPLTKDSLATTYKNYYIVSFAPGIPNGARSWSGERFGRPASGLLAGSLSDIGSIYMQIPTMAPVPRNWNRGIHDIHDINAFLSLSASDLKIVGQETIDGQLVYIVENTKTHPYIKDATGFLATCHTKKVLRVWLDPMSGFLPLKMEWHIAIECDDPQYFYKEPELPYQVLTTDEIKETPNGGYYPSKTTKQMYGPDPTNWVPSDLSPEEYVKTRNTREPRITRAVHVIYTTIIEKIDTSPIDPAVFLLEFPDKTPYFDATKSKGGIQGLSDKELDKLTDSNLRKYSQSKSNMQSPPVKSRFSWWWLFVIMVVVLSVILIKRYLM